MHCSIPGSVTYFNIANTLVAFLMHFKQHVLTPLLIIADQDASCSMTLSFHVTIHRYGLICMAAYNQSGSLCGSDCALLTLVELSSKLSTLISQPTPFFMCRAF